MCARRYAPGNRLPYATALIFLPYFGRICKRRPDTPRTRAPFTAARGVFYRSDLSSPPLSTIFWMNSGSGWA